MEIKIIDALECFCKPALATIIEPCVSFPSVYYRQGMYKKIRKEYNKSTLMKGTEGYYFYTGLLPRILKFCKEKNVPIELIGEVEKLPFREPRRETLTGKVLNEEQWRVVLKAVEEQRGVLVAPTGEGKTLMAMSVISAFLTRDRKILWLCHTTDLVYQAAEVARKEMGIRAGIVADKKRELSRQLTACTRQSFVKIADEVGWDFDVVIVDEVHHISKFQTRKKDEENDRYFSTDAQYTEILKRVLAPVRIGLTATMPKTKEAELVIEAFLGPIIDKITIEEGQKGGRVADITIRFLKVPPNHSIKELRKYQDVYDAGVTNNRAQHVLIAEKTKEHVEKGDSVLILVNRIEHGNNILRACDRQRIPTFFARGATETNIRMELKEALNSKKIHRLIASDIFNEGIDIPEINVIVNAGGGKSDIRTLQILGRGLRRTETKQRLILYDVMCLDHHYLVNHLGERLATYSEMGWL